MAPWKTTFCALAAAAVLSRTYGAEEWPADEECAVGDEECAVSLRQLRGERRLAQANRHDHGEVPAAAADVDAEGPSAEAVSSAAAAKAPASVATAPVASATAADADESAAAPAASATAAEPVAAEAAESSAEPAASATSAEPVAAAAGTEAEADASDDSDSSGSSGSSSSGDEELVRGEFCCQHGQGMGHTDEDDVGASCYPSSKPEPYDYCDDADICDGPCNGTWVVGFCAFNATNETEDACATEVNVRGTGYVYTGSPARAASGYCATEDACGSSECNGTWCHYVKTPIY